MRKEGLLGTTRNCLDMRNLGPKDETVRHEGESRLYGMVSVSEALLIHTGPHASNTSAQQPKAPLARSEKTNDQPQREKQGPYKEHYSKSSK